MPNLPQWGRSRWAEGFSPWPFSRAVVRHRDPSVRGVSKPKDVRFIVSLPSCPTLPGPSLLLPGYTGVLIPDSASKGAQTEANTYGQSRMWRKRTRHLLQVGRWNAVFLRHPLHLHCRPHPRRTERTGPRACERWPAGEDGAGDQLQGLPSLSIRTSSLQSGKVTGCLGRWE